MTFVSSVDVSGRKTGHIKLHGEEDFDAMRRAGRLAAEALDLLTEYVRPGFTTEALDKLVFEFAIAHNAYPAPLDYRGYRKSICTSINHVVCHGIPDRKPLREGDILNIDVTLILDGWHGDSSRMYYVGEVPRRAHRLVEVTYEALMRGMAAVRPGGTTGDIGEAIQDYAESERCSVVRDFCGHGLGRLFHDEPNIINFGRPHVKILSDGWTAVTRDRSLSAQFEHSVGVTETGCEVFTFSPKGLDRPPYPAAKQGT